MSKQRSITLTEELDRFVEDYHISLSKFVQDKLRERKEAVEK